MANKAIERTAYGGPVMANVGRNGAMKNGNGTARKQL
jgi:hypothetical protein